MPARLLTRIAGVITDTIAATVGGAASANQVPSLDGNGLLPASMLPAGTGDDLVTGTASEALAAGAFVNFYANSGAFAVRNADSSIANAGKKANGFVLQAYAANATGVVVYSHGLNTGLTGLSPGVDYYLSTAGGVQTLPATPASGSTLQFLGTATAAGVIDAQPTAPIAIQ